jgi:hypothetical protein
MPGQLAARLGCDVRTLVKILSTPVVHQMINHRNKPVSGCMQHSHASAWAGCLLTSIIAMRLKWVDGGSSPATRVAH